MSVVFAFGDAELNPALYELRRDGARVALEPQAFDVLLHLLEHRDRVVSKEELMDSVWGGRFVSETAVTSRIKQLRRALGDDGQAQRVIRTQHGRGYRFVAPVTEAGGSTAFGGPASAPTQPSSMPARPSSVPPVQYTTSDGLQIAYQVTGHGSRDIVLVPGFVSHLELDWGDPRHAAFLDRLGSFGRLVRFDKRGTGMSDRPAGLPDLETRMHDLLAVMDDADSRRAVVFGYSEGAPMAVLFAAAHPERVAGLVLYGGYAKRLHAHDYPWAPTREERARYAERLAHEWAWEADLRAMCPSADEAMALWWGQRARAAATPTTARALVEMNSVVDVRDVLRSVRVPTLVVHRRGDRDSRPEEGRYIAERIPGAQFVELPGADHFVAIDPDQILDPVEAFLNELDPAAPPEVSLAVVLAFAADEHDLVRRAAVAGGGRQATTDDGRPVVTFDGPAAAIRSVMDAVTGTGAAVGAVIAELPRDARPIPIQRVQVAGALADQAASGEVWTTATIADLAAGSGLSFRPGGELALPGVGRQTVFRVIGAGPPAGASRPTPAGPGAQIQGR